VTETRFIQIHSLQSFPATLLNRDDSGLAKRLPFGGAMRTRVSSQCLKRHWRVAEDEWGLDKLDVPRSVRSRMVPESRIGAALREDGVADEETVDAMVTAFARNLYGKDGKDVSKRQALLLGNPEIDYLTRRAREILAEVDGPKVAGEAIDALFKKDEKANLKAMLTANRLNAGLEAALFGRMVTSDPEANTDAAIHVAHAFTVHAEETESDYFTVVDDLTRAAGETGAAGLFDTELASGLYYVYVVVDVPRLISNLGDDDMLAGRVVEHLVHLIATVSPGAKLGSTAPYAYAELMLVETGKRQPRTLANAFRQPVEAQIPIATDGLNDYLKRLDDTYGRAESRQHLSTEGRALSGSEGPVDLDTLARFACEAVRGENSEA